MIAVFSWMKHTPETRFLKETGFLTTSLIRKTLYINSSCYARNDSGEIPPYPPFKRGGQSQSAPLASRSQPGSWERRSGGSDLKRFVVGLHALLDLRRPKRDFSLVVVCAEKARLPR